jgi:NAD(P)-dependent dehydrogenase (short-subunit alcohol dehydrogenase family)
VVIFVGAARLTEKDALDSMEETMSEQQRVALVTGAAGGIGRAIVGGLLGQGLAVAAVDRTAQGLAELQKAAEERQQGGRLLTIETDLAQDEAIPEIVAKARARFGTIDILVNNAGVGQATLRSDNRQNPIKFWEVTTTRRWRCRGRWCTT